MMPPPQLLHVPHSCSKLGICSKLHSLTIEKLYFLHNFLFPLLSSWFFLWLLHAFKRGSYQKQCQECFFKCCLGDIFETLYGDDLYRVLLIHTSYGGHRVSFN